MTSGSPEDRTLYQIRLPYPDGELVGWWDPGGRMDFMPPLPLYSATRVWFTSAAT